MKGLINRAKSPDKLRQLNTPMSSRKQCRKVIEPHTVQLSKPSDTVKAQSPYDPPTDVSVLDSGDEVSSVKYVIKL